MTTSPCHTGRVETWQRFDRNPTPSPSSTRLAEAEQAVGVMSTRAAGMSRARVAASFADLTTQLWEDDERLIAAYSVQRMIWRRADGTHAVIGPVARGAPTPRVLVSDRRLMVVRCGPDVPFARGLHKPSLVNNHWSWSDLPLTAISSVSPVRRGRFSVDAPSAGVRVEFVFELWALRRRAITAVRSSVAQAASAH